VLISVIAQTKASLYCHKYTGKVLLLYVYLDF